MAEGLLVPLPRLQLHLDNHVHNKDQTLSPPISPTSPSYASSSSSTETTLSSSPPSPSPSLSSSLFQASSLSTTAYSIPLSPSASTTTQITTFLTRNSLPPSTPKRCIALLHTLYPNSPISPLPIQGFCSLTYALGTKTIIQFRPPKHALNVSITASVSRIHGGHAPATEFLGGIVLEDSPCHQDEQNENEGDEDKDKDKEEKKKLLIYKMSRIPGLSLTEFRDSSFGFEIYRSKGYLEGLCKSLARFMAMSWDHPLPLPLLFDHYHQIHPHQQLGKVGSTLRERLELLHQKLPTRFRQVTGYLLQNFRQITSLPWVLNHGDLLPSNIIVTPYTYSEGEGEVGGEMKGIVDWAEAEYLPFGTSFYGLEELLGYYNARNNHFEYFLSLQTTNELREGFWRELRRNIGVGMRKGEGMEGMEERVKMARDLGVLLWWGFAWDGGRIDRVVDEGDGEEMGRLDVLLDLGDYEKKAKEGGVGMGTKREDGDGGFSGGVGMELGSGIRTGVEVKRLLKNDERYM